MFASPCIWFHCCLSIQIKKNQRDSTEKIEYCLYIWSASKIVWQIRQDISSFLFCSVCNLMVHELFDLCRGYICLRPYASDSTVDCLSKLKKNQRDFTDKNGKLPIHLICFTNCVTNQTRYKHFFVLFCLQYKFPWNMKISNYFDTSKCSPSSNKNIIFKYSIYFI